MRADEVGAQSTIAQLRSSSHVVNPAARPGHDDQIVAGEQLGAPDDDDRGSERQYRSTEPRGWWPSWQVRVAGDDGGSRARRKPMPPPATTASMKDGRNGHVRLLHPDFFDRLLDFRGAVGVETENGRRRGCAGRPCCVSCPWVLSSLARIENESIDVPRRIAGLAPGSPVLTPARTLNVRSQVARLHGRQLAAPGLARRDLSAMLHNPCGPKRSTRSLE